MSDLTPKQQRFIEEYLVDLNATQAAIRAEPYVSVKAIYHSSYERGSYERGCKEINFSPPPLGRTWA